MTGNVAQVFVTDDGVGRRRCDGMRDGAPIGGHLVFEVRDPRRERMAVLER